MATQFTVYGAPGTGGVIVEAALTLAEVVRGVDAEPRLQPLWAERYPFADGWEG